MDTFDLSTLIAYATVALGGISAVLLVTRPLMALSHRFRDWAAESQGDADDRAARVFVRFAESLHGSLVKLQTFLLAIVGGVPSQSDAKPRARRNSSGRGGTALLVLLVVLPLAASSSACGATQIERARTVLSVSGRRVVAAEAVFEPRFEAAGERARAESATWEEYAAAMEPWFRGATSIRLTAAALRLAESQVDAIEAGQAGDVMGVVACVTTSLVQLLDALAAVVDVPDELVLAIHGVSAFAGECSPPAQPTIAVAGGES